MSVVDEYRQFRFEDIPDELNLMEDYDEKRAQMDDESDNEVVRGVNRVDDFWANIFALKIHQTILNTQSYPY